MQERFDKSQTEIAKRLDIDANYVSRILSLPTKKGHKRISGDYAREIESKLGLARGFLDGEPTDRLASSRVADVGTLPYHGHQLTDEAARFAAEWMKLRSPLKAQIQAMVETLVAEQVRDGRTPPRPPRDPSARQRYAET